FSRFVFLPTTDNELNSWFTGPLFEFYTDRKVVVASAGERLEPDEKVLILKHRDQQRVIATIERQAGRELVNEKCGPRFCAYDVQTVGAFTQ
ncbi:MAG: hypothetical protein GY906_29780, partial [bacterium]|nr:hypothetical protein [bacterium]